MRSYGSIYNLGHKAVIDIFDGPVVIEEKYDGSQFSFKREGDEVFFKSKNCQIVAESPPNLFKPAVDTILAVKDRLFPGWTYRGEAICRPKHNTLTYAAPPPGGAILFDIDQGEEDYLAPALKQTAAQDLGLLSACTLYSGIVDNRETLHQLLERESSLGGCKIEGYVVKRYDRFGEDKKILMAKHVSEEFKEKHGRNPEHNKASFMESLCALYRNENRWAKAIQHLRDDGKLENSPRDIGLLMREVPSDILKECEGEIKDALFKNYWKDIHRASVRGLPEFYKNYLLETQKVSVK